MDYKVNGRASIIIRNLLRSIISSRFPDIYIFLFIGIVIAGLDILLTESGGKPLFYNHIVSRGIIGFIITYFTAILLLPFSVQVVIPILISPFRKWDKEIIEQMNDIVIDYLKSQNIYLNPQEETYIVDWLPHRTCRGVVLTNQRIFQYKSGHILQQVYLKDVDKVYYENKRTGLVKITFQLEDRSSYIFEVIAIFSRNMIDKLKEMLKEKVEEKKPD